MASLGGLCISPRTVRYLAVLVMLAGLAVVVYLEATTEDGTVGILVIAAGLVLSAIANSMARRSNDEAAGQ